MGWRRMRGAARPDFVRIVEATLESLIPASCNTFSSRWMARVRSSTRVLRYRVKSRSSRIGGGTNEGRTKPCSTSCAIHAESATSVFRPGTFFMWAAVSSQTSGIRSSSR